MRNPVKATITRDGKPLSEIRQDFRRAINKAVEDIGKHFVERAVPNTSVDTGDLRESIRYQVVKSPIYPKVVVYAGNDGNIQYAWSVHELHTTPAGTGLQNTPAAKGIGPGKRTSNQPMTPEGGAGGKYLQRVAFYNAKAWQLHSAKLIAAALGGDNATVNINLSPLS